MATLESICNFLNGKLNLKAFASDVSNNGLQFEGAREVRKMVFGVDGCDALFCTAADLDADFIFVHHGISWGGSLKRITGLSARRVACLAANGMSLYAAHLPLDANAEFGHNIQLARMVGLKECRPFGEYDGSRIGFSGLLPKKMSVKALGELFDEKLASEGAFTIFGDAGRQVEKIGIISGGGAYAEAFDEIFAEGIECLVTGEMTHEAFHPALESGASVLSLGHYRSETPGVLAVMELIRKEFPDIETEFVDLPTQM